MSNQNYLDGVDIIYWINLERAKDREKHMKKLLDDPIFNNIMTRQFKAIDVNGDKNIYDMLDIKEKKMSDNEYACLLSHLETIRKFSNSNYENALIFEDDVSLDYKKYWDKTIQEVIDNAPKDWEILKLCCFKHKPYKKEYNLWNYLPGSGNTDTNWSCVSYLINNKAANKIIKSIYIDKKYKLENTLPHQADFYIYSKLKTYGYKYPYFTYRDNNDTYVQKSSKGWKHEKKNKITKFLKKTIKNISPKKRINNKTKRNKTKRNKTKRNKTKR